MRKFSRAILIPGMIAACFLLQPKPVTAQQPQIAEWCTNCSSSTGQCILTYGVGGFYHCENTSNGCLLSEPGCNKPDTFVINRDGTVRVPESHDHVVSTGEAVSGGFGCPGWLLERHYTAKVQADIRKRTAFIRT